MVSLCILFTPGARKKVIERKTDKDWREWRSAKGWVLITGTE
jgi:hypothetical protein